MTHVLGIFALRQFHPRTSTPHPSPFRPRSTLAGAASLRFPRRVREITLPSMDLRPASGPIPIPPKKAPHSCNRGPRTLSHRKGAAPTGGQGSRTSKLGETLHARAPLFFPRIIPEKRIPSHVHELQVELAKWYHPAVQRVKCAQRETAKRKGGPPARPSKNRRGVTHWQGEQPLEGF